MSVVDFLRLAALGEIFLSVGFMLALFVQAERYSRLPLCLRALSLSYVLFALGTANEITLRFHHPATWRTPVALVAATAGLFSQAGLYAYYWRIGSGHAKDEWVAKGSP